MLYVPNVYGKMFGQLYLRAGATMSLSDEERLSGMYHAVRELTGIAHSWREDHRMRDGMDRDQYSRVRDLVDKLWPVFLGSQSNGLHWIMGSDSSNPITHEPTTPWAMAITGHLEGIAQKINRDDPPWENPDYKPPFNAIDFTNIQYLLSHGENWEAYGVAQGYIFRIYQWVEQLIYYLRRYNDDFLARFKELSDLVANIQGECYRVFSQNPNYAKAYLIREMMDILYGPGYPYDPNPDVVTQILTKETLHHDFTGLMKLPLETLAKHHVEMVRARVKAQRKAEDRHKFGADEELLRLRLFKTIEFSRKSHEYEHIRKSIVKLLEDSPLAKYIPEVEKEWDRLAAEFKEKKEDKDDQYSDDSDMRALYAYGPWRGYEFISDFLEDEGLHPRKNKKEVPDEPDEPLPPKGKVHYQEGDAYPACSDRLGPNIRHTDDPNKVTCGNCKKTREYKAKIKKKKAKKKTAKKKTAKKKTAKKKTAKKKTIKKKPPIKKKGT